MLLRLLLFLQHVLLLLMVVVAPAAADARGVSISVGVLFSSLLRQAEPGDSFDIGGSTFVLEHVSRKPMAMASFKKETMTA